MSPRIRPATPADLGAVEQIVRDAYGHYIARIGREPGPMLDDYGALISEGRVCVIERGGAVLGLPVLIPQADAMLLDNIAVSPSRRGLRASVWAACCWTMPRGLRSRRATAPSSFIRTRR